MKQLFPRCRGLGKKQKYCCDTGERFYRWIVAELRDGQGRTWRRKVPPLRALRRQNLGHANEASEALFTNQIVFHSNTLGTLLRAIGEFLSASLSDNPQLTCRFYDDMNGSIEDHPYLDNCGSP